MRGVFSNASPRSQIRRQTLGPTTQRSSDLNGATKTEADVGRRIPKRKVVILLCILCVPLLVIYRHEGSYAFSKTAVVGVFTSLHRNATLTADCCTNASSANDDHVPYARDSTAVDSPDVSHAFHVGHPKLRFSKSKDSDSIAPIEKDEHPKVALLFPVVGEIHNEPVWRAFFEAAGRLQFRFEFPDSPELHFTWGEGRKKFDMIKNELGRRALQEEKAPRRSVNCDKESMHIDNETERLLESALHVDGWHLHFRVSEKQLREMRRTLYRYPDTSVFHGTEIAERVNLTNAWGMPIVVQAELNLFRAALKDARNKKFALLSESCVPLYRPEVIYLNLLSENKSRIDACKTQSLNRFMYRYDEQLATNFFNETSWRKSGQWLSLTRPHAELLVDDVHLYERFDAHCHTRDMHFCAADESYIPSVLALHGRDSETDCTGKLTESWWTGGPHPRSFSPGEVHIHLLQQLRGDASSCPGALAQASSQFLLADRMHQNHCVVYKTTDLVFTLPEKANNWITESGFRALGSQCGLFARKFPKESVVRTLDAALSCDGVGLGYWC